MSSAVGLIAANDLRRRVRNRSAIVMAFLGPLAMALVFGALLGGTADVSFTLGVLDLDGSARSASIAEGMIGADTGGPVTFTALHDEASARRAVDDGDVGAAIVFEPGFGDAGSNTTPGLAPELGVLRRPDRLVSGQVAESIARSIAARSDTVTLAAELAAARTGTGPSDELIGAAQEAASPLALADRPVGAREVSAAAYFGASMSILFLFFTVGFAARSTLAEAREGTLARVLATPTRPAQVLAGKTISVAVLALAGMVTVWLATWAIFGANWGSPAAVLALMAATVAAIAGVATFVASLARTERQADAATSATTFALALLGGNFTGPGQGPALLRTLSLLTPNGWALRGFTDLSADAASFRGIAGSVAVLVAIALVTGTIGLVRIHRGMLR